MKRPNITVNCAASIDGKISTSSRIRVGISGKGDRERVMRLRKSHDAVAVGIGTVLADDPALSVGGSRQGRKTMKVVFDSRGKTPATARLLSGEADVIIVTGEECRKNINGARMLRCGRKRVDIARAMNLLYKEGVESILVEGGGEIIFELARLNMIDTLSVFTAPLLIGGRTAPTIADGEGFQGANRFRRFELSSVRKYDGGLLTEYTRVSGSKTKR